MSESKAVNMRSHLPMSTHLETLRNENPDIAPLLAVYPEEEAAKLISNKSKLAKIARAFDSVSVARSQASMVMTCQHDCPYKDICILKKEDLAPYGHPCPIERKVIYQLEADVIKSLDIETDNPIEMELLWDLIDMKLLDMRASATMKDGKLITKVESKMGKVVSSRDEISPLLEAKLDLKRLKHSIIDAFVATRRAKKKYGMQSDANSIEQLILQAAANAKDTDDGS